MIFLLATSTYVSYFLLTGWLTRNNGCVVGCADSGTFEIEEEPIFPLTRRAEMLGLETKTLSKESDARSPPNEEVFSFNVGREPDIEIFEDDEDDEISGLDEALAIRGDKIRSLSRIREDEPEEFEDGSPLHLALNPRGDSPEALGDIIGKALSLPYSLMFLTAGTLAI